MTDLQDRHRARRASPTSERRAIVDRREAKGVVTDRPAVANDSVPAFAGMTTGAQAESDRVASDSAPLQEFAQAASDRIACPAADQGSDRGASDSAPALSSRSFLIVTAPFGPFGAVLADQLEAQGAQVRRMLFNIGDVVYWRRKGGVPYDGDVRDWPAHLSDLVTRHGLTDLIVFGEGGPYNQAVLTQGDALKALAKGVASGEWRVASEEGGASSPSSGSAESDLKAFSTRHSSLVTRHSNSPAQAASARVASGSAPLQERAQAASARGASGSAPLQERAQAASARVASGSALRIWVLENGYFRPDWITVEQDGVNARSGLERHRSAYDPPIPEIVPARPVGRALPHHVAHISLYHFLQFLVRPFVFRRYAQPYTTPPWLQCASHIRRYFGLMLRPVNEADAQVIRARGPFFIACLQREGDAQLLRYSHYADNTAFLAEVLTSFADHAPGDARLVVKNHPLDPGLVDLRRMTQVLAIERGVADRVDFIDGGNLAQLCRASDGMVVNNSSAALSALGFRTPVKVLGQAFFDIEGLTDPKPLDAFWTDPTTPDPDLFARFRAHVIARTQVNGNYHHPRALIPTANALAQRFASAG